MARRSPLFNNELCSPYSRAPRYAVVPGGAVCERTGLMTEQDRMTSLFFELFTGLPRQGPGDDASTLKALALVPDVGPDTRVLDLGCGTGRQTRTLAGGSPARFVGIDNHLPYVEAATQEARTCRWRIAIMPQPSLNLRVIAVIQPGLDPYSCQGLIQGQGRAWRSIGRQLADKNLPMSRRRTRGHAAIGV
jgi:hypothetical protein